MKDSDALYELVHALGKNEKRYFKMYCSGLSSRNGNNYLQLFDALRKQKTYDAAALKRSLKNPALVKNLSTEKNYLFHLILDSLLVYHREEPVHKIRMMISKSQLLYDKGLVKPSAKMLVAAKKMARAYDSKGLIFSIIAAQNKRLVHLRQMKQMKEYMQEERQLALEVLNENKYNLLLAELVEYSLDTTYMRIPEQRAKLDQLMQDEFLQDESKATTLQSKLLFYHVWSFYYFLVKKPGHIMESNRSMLRLYEENPGHTSVNLNDYLSVMSNFFSDAMSNGKKEDVMHALQKLEEFPVTYKQHLSPIIYENYRHLYLETVAKVNTWLGEFDKTISLLPEMKALVANERVLKPHRRQSVAVNTALALFAFKRYKEMFRLLQQVENIHEAGAGSYLYFMQAMFLRFITHYESGNTEVLEEQATWLRQFLVKQGKLHRTEELLLEFFIDLPAITSAKERRAHFEKAYKQVNELLKDSYEYPFLRTLMFVYNWIKANVEQLDFVTVVKNR